MAILFDKFKLVVLSTIPFFTDEELFEEASISLRIKLGILETCLIDGEGLLIGKERLETILHSNDDIR